MKFFVTSEANNYDTSVKHIADVFDTRAEAQAFIDASEYASEYEIEEHEASTVAELVASEEADRTADTEAYEHTKLVDWIAGQLAIAVREDATGETHETLVEASRPFLLPAEGEAYMSGDGEWPTFSALCEVLADEYGATDIQWWYGTDGLRFALTAKHAA